MKILILTVGLPRSGKSSWSRQQTFPVVNPDSIRLALHGLRFAPEAEPFVWAIDTNQVDLLPIIDQMHLKFEPLGEDVYLWV
jgi:predicted kinase